MKALILAAGFGSRLKPITEKIPKALVQINGRTLLEIIVQRLIASGCSEIIINVHHLADQIKEYLVSQGNFGIKIEISDESDKLLDTGGGLKKVQWFFTHGQSFLVHNIDIISDIDLALFYRHHFRSEALITLAVQKRESSRYLLFDQEKNLCGWKNIKTNESIIVRDPIGQMDQFAFSGIQVADPKIFYMMPNKDTFSLIDFFLAVAPKHDITYYDHSNSLFIDAGKIENLAIAEEFLKH